jgi:ATP-binding cassette, subfamily B, bacterial PglK
MSFRARFDSAVGDFVLVIGPAWRRAPWVLFLMSVSVALELAAVLLAAPFVSLLIGQSSSGIAVPAWLVSMGTPKAVTLEAIGALVAIVFIFKAVISTRLQYAIAWFSEQRRAELMLILLKSYQHKQYDYYLTRNSSELVNRVIWETQYFTGAGLNSIMRLIVESVMALVLVSVLALVDWHALALLLICLFIVFMAVLRSVRQATATNTALAQSSQTRTIGTVHQALGAFREVRLLGCEELFRSQLASSARDQAVSTARGSGLAGIPRQAIECTIVCFLVLLVYARSFGGGALDGVLVTLGTFAMAAMRLMPASTALLGCLTSIRSVRPITHSLANELRELSLAPTANVRHHVPREPFESIELRAVSYHYPNQKNQALKGISLSIRKGELIGIMGRSGSGKSTLADVLLGFLHPQEGEILVNGRSTKAEANLTGLQQYAAYIPQTVFLLDDTIRRNVAFGEPDEAIDDNRVANALAQAQLSEFVASLPDGQHTQVGERGVRMSGGQRQRVAIARAIYHRREVIVLDEATSALDAQTERDVVSALNHLHGQQTLIVIAHKASVLAVADRIVRVVDGRLHIEDSHAKRAQIDASLAEIHG